MYLLRSSLFLGALMLSAATAGQPAAVKAPAALPDAESFFTAPALAETRALLVMHKGRIVYERYAPGYGPGNRFISWSMAKSVTSTLVGALVSDGRLELDTPAPVPAWRSKPGDPRAGITLRHLLHMSSGLRHVESGPTPELSDTNRALFADRSADIAAAALAAPLEETPGTLFKYSTLTTHILSDIMGRTLAPDAAPEAKRKAVRQFLEARLIAPAAMPTLVCEFDMAGTLLGGSFCHASLRDWGAFGQLYLDDGRVAGRQVVSRDWIRFVRTPAATDGGYGGHFWLNLPRAEGREDVLFPSAGPRDAYGAVGHLGQYLLIVPSRQLVVVRLGNTPDTRRAGLRTALVRLVNSFPELAE